MLFLVNLRYMLVRLFHPSFFFIRFFFYKKKPWQSSQPDWMGRREDNQDKLLESWKRVDYTQSQRYDWMMMTWYHIITIYNARMEKNLILTKKGEKSSRPLPQLCSLACLSIFCIVCGWKNRENVFLQHCWHKSWILIWADAEVP